MTWNSGWDDVFRAKEWGKYPPEELVRFVGRAYFGAPDRSAVRFLEIGCGAGANLLFLAQEGFDATGLDGSAVALDRARQRFAERGLTARFDQGEAMHLPYDDFSFDCVLDIECIYANTLADSRRIIAEAHRVVKPGGLFFSKTFMTDMTGTATGKRLETEANTFLEMPDGPLNKGYGIIRLTSEEDIPALYGGFPDVSVDFVIRSDGGRTKRIGEWVITCRK
ncbi:MAG TPA: class I SAM-dependent methyltransferase [Thermoanaerobaculia bacterium]|nr:class I SAM-dependent methyltransferase [Thermoanaerobaculia bacterium]